MKIKKKHITSGGKGRINIFAAMKYFGLDPHSRTIIFYIDQHYKHDTASIFNIKFYTTNHTSLQSLQSNSCSHFKIHTYVI